MGRVDLFVPPELTSSETSVLAHVDELKRQMVYRFQPKRWFGLLRRNTFATAVRASNSIEGIVVSVDDAVAAVEGEEPIDEKSENWFAVAGYRRAMTMVLQQAGVPYFEYSVGFLNSLHFMMLDFDLVRRPGNWRTGPIFVVDGERNEIVYDAPPAESLSDLMQALIEDLQRHEDLHPVVKAAMAHLNLVMIHPYSDGNGRMGRCLQSLVLARSGVLHPAFASVEEYLGRNTRDYYRVLAEVGQGRWNPMRDTRAWIRFMLTAHYRQATTLMRRSTFYQQLFDVLDEAAERLDLPERTVQAMADAVLGAKVRNATYRKLTDVSMRAAGRDLGLLVEAGFLEPMGKKRGRYYLAAPSLFELTRAVPRPAPVDDPFESLEKGELSFES